MNGKKERLEETKSWDLSNWGLNKEDIQQTQDMISKQHIALSTDTIENQTQNDIVIKDNNDKDQDFSRD